MDTLQATTDEWPDVLRMRTFTARLTRQVRKPVSSPARSYHTIPTSGTTNRHSITMHPVFWGGGVFLGLGVTAMWRFVTGMGERV